MRYLTNKENDIELKSVLTIFTSQIDSHKKGNLMLCVMEKNSINSYINEINEQLDLIKLNLILSEKFLNDLEI